MPSTEMVVDPHDCIRSDYIRAASITSAHHPTLHMCESGRSSNSVGC